MIKSKNLILGICAHVDAGKTTLSEGLLYLGGSIRKMGRVDSGDAFLDTDEMERARGITIFSKQAQFSIMQSDGTQRVYTLLDTPGHADFSPEMERTLQVLDLAILVISSADGVNAQVKTLWSLLKHYNVPTFIYVNKMDQMENLGEGDAKREELLAEIQENLNANALQLAPYASRSDGQRDDFCHAPGGDEFSHPMPANGESERSFASLRMTGAEECRDSSRRHGCGEEHSSSMPANGESERSFASLRMTDNASGKSSADEGSRAEIRTCLLEYLADSDLQESLALCDEDLLNRFMEGEMVGPADIEMLVAERKLFPVFFGSALKMQGVEELLEGLNLYSPIPVYPEEFSARVFKITRDGRDRLTWMKITGGSIVVRKELIYIGRKSGEAPGSGDGDGEAFAEKITQIRLYSGDKFAPLPEANAGCVCAVCGLTATYAGQGLGANATENVGLIVPVLTWQIRLPQGVDPFKAYRDLCVIEEEEPMLQVAYNERKGEITACVMGEIQRDVLKKIVKDRFDLEIAFGRPQVMYRETIAEPVEGVGHFEPLRHYAEVHLLLEPGEPGSGLVFDSKCSVDSLARNWQRLVLTHLRERRHKGVLTGSEITDMKITLIGGRAHEKHTEGGDFRQATYRAVRQGLMMARNVLLEPYYNFRIELPQGNLGRALTDLQQMGASFGPPDIDGDEAILTGSAPVSELGDYAEKLGSYTKGRGRLLFEMGGYRPCHNMEETVAQFGYDPDADKRNPAASVFCSHGAGVIVPWNEVRDHMHVDTGWREGVTSSDGMFSQSGASRAGAVNAEEERVFVAAGDGRRMEDEIGAGQEKRKGADGKGRADVGGAGVEGAPMDNDAGTKEQPVGSDAGDGAREAGSGRGAAEGRLPKKLAGQGMSEGGIHLQDEMSMDAETDDSQYASAGYGSVGIRAGRALEPAADLQDYKERQRAAMAEEEELKSIFERTYGPIKSSIGPAADTGPRRVTSAGERGKFRKPKPRPEKEYLLVDGYNILFAWDEFRTLAQADMKAARDALLERLSNYAGFAKKNLICVFDAYRVAGGNEQVYRYHNIDVIFTREAETADQYIEKAAHELSRQYQVTVATSDAIEQIIIYGAGAIRLSARNFLAEVESAVREMQKTYITQDTDRSQTVGSSVGEEIRKALERQGN